jgi:hypothetical protein
VMVMMMITMTQNFSHMKVTNLPALHILCYVLCKFLSLFLPFFPSFLLQGGHLFTQYINHLPSLGTVHKLMECLEIKATNSTATNEGQ